MLPSVLLQHFKPEPILAAAGITVKGVIPDVIICPFCDQHLLTIQYDPAAIGSYWLYCSACRFSGDLVEFLARVYELENIHEVVERAIREKICEGGADLSSTNVEAYVQEHHCRLVLRQTVWRAMRENMLRVKPEMTQRLQENKLWISVSNPVRERLSQFLGGGSKREINDLILPLFKRRVLPEKGFRTAVVLNYQDAPGRPCAFRFMGENTDLLVPCPGGDEDDYEGGLALLETIKPREETIFAFGDFELPFHLQRKWLHSDLEPLKTVVFNPHTKAAWQNVYAKKVILWDKEIDWHLFAQARLVENAHITACPRLTDSNFYDYTSGYTPKETQDTMENNAKPWRVFFSEWITDRDLPEFRARSAVANLKLDTRDRQKILEECAPGLRPRLSNIIGELVAANHGLIKNSHVVEQADGWWIDRDAKGKELICDAVVKLETEINNPQTGYAVWQGYIKFRGEDIPFKESVAKITEDVPAWLVIALAGKGSPYVEPSWKGHLESIIRTFSQPKIVQGITNLGMQPDGTLVFPQFKITQGQVVTTDAAYVEDDMPASKITPFAAGYRPRNCDTLCDFNLMYMVIASAFIANQIRIYRKEPIEAVGIIGSPGSLGRLAAERFAERAGMKKYTLGTGKLEELRDFHGKQLPYNYPVYVECTGPNTLRNYSANVTDHLLMSMESLEASILNVTGNWRFIDSPSVTETEAPAPASFHDVIKFFKEMQQAEYAIEAGGFIYASLTDRVLREFCKYRARESHTDAEALIAGTSRFLCPAKLPGTALIEMYMWLYRLGKIGMEHKALGAKQTGVPKIRVDDTRFQVLLPRGILSLRNLPILPDVTNAVLDLQRRSLLRPETPGVAGWVIDLKTWNSCGKDWMQVDERARLETIRKPVTMAMLDLE